MTFYVLSVMKTTFSVAYMDMKVVERRSNFQGVDEFKFSSPRE